MKKLITMLLALAMACTSAAALADVYVPKHISEYDGLPYTPALSTFAAMRTKRERKTYWENQVYHDDYEDIVTIYLSKPVDSLIANWLGYMEEPEELEVSDELTATLDISGHKYQVGAHWTNAYEYEAYNQPMTENASGKKVDSEQEQYAGYDPDSKRDIAFGAGPATIDQAKDQASTYQTDWYYCVKVVEPYYAVAKELGNDQFCILSQYKQTTPLSQINVPAGFKLYKVDGYAVAWHPTYAASDGTSDGRYTVAYLTEQEDWTVAYGRNGKIQWFYLTIPDSEFFDQGLGVAKVQFEPCNTGWFIREVTEVYDDGSYVSAFYSRTGNGKLSYYKTGSLDDSDI